jgi:hypothetical protein
VEGVKSAIQANVGEGQLLVSIATPQSLRTVLMGMYQTTRPHSTTGHPQSSACEV